MNRIVIFANYLSNIAFINNSKSFCLQFNWNYFEITRQHSSLTRCLRARFKIFHVKASNKTTYVAKQWKLLKYLKSGYSEGAGSVGLKDFLLISKVANVYKNENLKFQGVPIKSFGLSRGTE